ncbi:hypothetical protein SCUP515_09691 [Seiridium cupressi]
MAPYIYQQLEADEIRLLELYAGGQESDLQAALHRFRLPEDVEPNEGHQVLVTREDGFNVPNAPEFEALSYTWGQTSGTSHTLKIMELKATSELDIRPSLHGALERLRQDIPLGESRFLWIDAVSINQSDLNEKNTQIPKMAMIYNRAKGVCVWLGLEDEDSGKAMDFVNKLLDLNGFDPLTKDPGSSTEWAALLNLMRRPWFHRRWIVQEISLARHATLFCGPGSISWLEFSAAVALFVSRYSDLRQLLGTPKDHLRHLDQLGENAAMGAVALVNLTNNVFRKSEDGTILERLLSLEGLITRMTTFQSTAPHDTIYAVLWLAHDAQPDAHDPAAMSEAQLLQTPEDSPQIDPVLSEDECSDIGMEVNLPMPRSVNIRTSFPRARSPERSGMLTQAGSSAGTWLRPPLPGLPTSFSGRSATDRSLQRAENHFQDYPGIIKVDYSKSVQEVLSDFLEFAISRSKTIDIICYPWAPEPAQDEPVLPTWICPASTIPHEKKRKEDLYDRESADPLVGYPGQGPRNYNASGRTRTYPSKGFISGPTFTVTGFVLDTIGTKGSPAHEGIIPSTWLELVDWPGSPEPVPDQLWRTLVADKGLDGKRYPPAYFPLACKWMFEQRKHGGDVDTTEILTSAQCPSIITEFMRRVQSVVWGKRLIRTEGRRGAKQLLGLVPAKVEAGDLVCILYGCSVPVVLRRTKHTSGNLAQKSAEPTPRIEINTPGTDGGASSDISSLPVPVMNNASSSSIIQQTALAETTSSNYQEEDMGDNVNQGRLGDSLHIPSGEISLKHASSGVRKAFGEDTPEKRPPNLILSAESRFRCEVIGACYIHGMMEGEAFKYRREYGLKLRTFYLV